MPEKHCFGSTQASTNDMAINKKMQRKAKIELITQGRDKERRERDGGIRRGDIAQMATVSKRK